MTKYYNKDIPDKVHAMYGGRQSGKTYYEFNKIIKENERLKEDLEAEKSTSSNLAKRILKALKLIEKNIELNNNFLSNTEVQLIYILDLIRNENDVLNCLKEMLEGEEK